MQLSSEIKTDRLGPSAGVRIETLLPVSGLQLIIPLAAIVLAFVPLVPPVEALEGGVTSRGVIEFGLILIALAMLAISLKQQGAFSFDVKNAAFLVISMFCWWCMVSAIWSLNPILTLAKAAELWCVSLAAMMVATLALRSRFDEGKLETLLALSLVAVIAGLIVANIFFWGKPLPTTDDASLPFDILGEGFSDERPRLVLAYQHALVTADLLAIAIISVFTSQLRKVLKAPLLTGLLALFWMTNVRGGSIGLIVSIAAIALLKLRRNSVRLIAVMLSISAVVAGLMVVQDRLPALIRPLITDDFYTLNSRTELWSKTLSHIFARPILGHGFFASRYLLIRDFSWAGHAHNSFLEVLLTTGLIGLLILGAFLLVLCREILVSRNALLLGITLYCLIQGMLNPVLFFPGVAMFALTLALIYAEIKRSSKAQAIGRSRGGWR